MFSEPIYLFDCSEIRRHTTVAKGEDANVPNQKIKWCFTSNTPVGNCDDIASSRITLDQSDKANNDEVKAPTFSFESA